MKVNNFPELTTLADDDLLLGYSSEQEIVGVIKLSTLKDYLNIAPAPTLPTLTFSSVGDANGIAYYQGTNKNTTSWSNPHTSTKVVCAISGGGNGNLATLVDRSTQGNYTSNVANSWVSIDLVDIKLKPTHYTFRHDANDGYYARSWKFQGSNDNSTWTDLDTQTNNTQIASAYGWASIAVTGITTAYRYLRIQMTATNSAGTNEFCICEFEFYGEVVAL